MAANGSLLYSGYTAGAGSNEQSPPPDWSTGWVTAYQRTGAGGAPYATCTKVFAASNDLTGTWANAQGAIAHNGSVPLLPILVVQAAVPTSGALQTFIHNLPAGQKVAFQWQSEVENGPAQPAGNISTLGTFLGDWHAFSNNLNTALAALGGGFYNRANFPMINSAYMAYYASNPGSTAFIPPAADVDAYGADFYQHVGTGSTQNVGLQNDSRYQGYISAVHKVAGSNVALALPEYGIAFKNGYNSTDEAARAALLAKDYAYMTGSSRPSGTKPVLMWNYWYQWNNKAGNDWTFPATSTTETVSQASAVITQWQNIVANTGQQGTVTVTVTNPGTQSSTQGIAISSLAIHATDSAGNALTFSATGLPAGLSISSSGLITGTPTASGNSSVTVRALDAIAGVSGTASFTWQVSNATVTIVDPGAQSTHLASPVSLQIHGTDSNSLPLTWAISGQPTGLTIAPATGLITGTPSVAGSYSTTVSASDSTGAHNADTFAWTITTNTITVTNPGVQNNTVGDVVSQAITATDSDSLQTLSYAASGLPTGLTISATTGHITGTVTTAATYAVIVTVHDGTGASGTASFSWVVNTAGPDVVTVVNPGSQSSITQQAITPLQISAASSAHLTLTYSAGGTLPTGLSINSSTGLITGTPTAAGTYSVTITASDSTPASNNASFSWVVANAGLTVTSLPDQTNFVGNAVSIQMDATDSGGFSFTWSDGGTLPAGLSISSGGLISGTVTTVHVSAVTITATDSHSNVGTTSLTWTVKAPLVTVINPGDQANNQGDTVSLQISALDSNSLTLSYSAGGTLPAGLSISSSTGLITGTPTTPATYPVTITVTDTSSSVGSASFHWVIAPPLTTLVMSMTTLPGTDSFGNDYPAGAAFGVDGVSQTVMGLDGNVSLAAADGSPVLQLSPALQALLLYSDPAGLGALMMAAASVAGSDRYGNAFPAGILAASPLSIPEGSNARMGTATLNGTTAVTVATTAVTAKSRIFLTIQSPGGTPGAPYVFTITAGTSFQVKSSAGDTSTVAWLLIDHT